MIGGREEIESLLGELTEVLSQEKLSLRSRDPIGLETALQRKTTLIKALDAAAGKHCQDGGKLPADWPELQELAARCAEANRINGGAIALNRALVSGLLNALRGGANEQPTYDATGRVAPGDKARQVGYV